MLWPDRLTFATAGRLIAHTWCETGAHDDEEGGDDHKVDHNNDDGDGDDDDGDDNDDGEVGCLTTMDKAPEGGCRS